MKVPPNNKTFGTIQCQSKSSLGKKEVRTQREREKERNSRGVSQLERKQKNEFQVGCQ